MKFVEVGELARQFHLEVVAGGDGLNRRVYKSRSHRPGLEFAGFFDFFQKDRVQVIGLKEMHYLRSLGEEEQAQRIRDVISHHSPCFVVTTGQDIVSHLVQCCQAEGIPLLRTKDPTAEFIDKLDAYLARSLAPEIAIHGVCLNVSGIGILLRGKSGIGKSEVAHTLIRRGHRLVADDIVVLKKLSPRTLIGTHNKTSREFLALRSIGLINVVRLYGRKAFQDETRIALDIELTRWQEHALNNELEMEPKHSNYMDVLIPQIEIQLQPGRDVAGLIEAAANSWYLRQQGYSAAEEFMKRVEEDLEANR